MEGVAHSTDMGAHPSLKLSPSQLLRRRQQVAAVCYRVAKRGIEFLLVQSRGGRWIFPKGGVEPGLTHAQSAALEALEEAGAHGRMELIAFARYFRRERDPGADVKDARLPPDTPQPELAVCAYLCEVSRLEPPQESNRNPTWFPSDKAKLRLRKDRAPAFAAELVRVIDRAASRIRRLHGSLLPFPIHSKIAEDGQVRSNPVHCKQDPLQEVRFEASALDQTRYIRREALELRDQSMVSPAWTRPVLRLKGATTSIVTPAKVRFIDDVNQGARPKPTAKSARNRQR